MSAAAGTVDLTIPEMGPATSPAETLRQAAAIARGRAEEWDLAAALADLLDGTASRWATDVTLDRPDSSEYEPRHPEAWWCDRCQGAIASRDYQDDDRRCVCGFWVETLAIAHCVLVGARAVGGAV